MTSPSLEFSEKRELFCSTSCACSSLLWNHLLSNGTLALLHYYHIFVDYSKKMSWIGGGWWAVKGLGLSGISVTVSSNGLGVVLCFALSGVFCVVSWLVRSYATMA